MTPRLRFFLALSSLTVFSARAAEDAPLHDVLQAVVDRHIAPGVVVLVADRERVLDVEAAGCAELTTKTPMPKDAVGWIASMSKAMTSTVFMMLVDEGKVKIDDPVEKYLPEFKGQKVASADGGEPQGPKRPITIKDILTHTSGLITPGDPRIKRSHMLKENVEQFASMPLLREPGTKFEYNNAGIDTAGRIIEVLSGMPYVDVMQKRLFDPLGMKDTTFWPTEEQGKRWARSARLNVDKNGLEDVHQDKGLTPALIQKLGQGASVPAAVLADMGGDMLACYHDRYGEPAGGLFSTVADVGRFCQMLLNDGVYQSKRYLSAEALKQMTSVQTGDIPVNPQEAWGLGWTIRIRDDEGPSIGSFGHRGARRPVMWVDRKNQLAMVLLVERFDMSGDEQKEFYGSILKAAITRYGKR
jgi:CubicO group peptidase (beta-lactamase class C family)